MFENFTEKAVNIVASAQKQALKLGHDKVYSEHLLLGLIYEARGASEKILNRGGAGFDRVEKEVVETLYSKKTNSQNPHFSESFIKIIHKAFDIAKDSENNLILSEHLFLGILEAQNSGAYAILDKIGFDVAKAKATLYTLIKKSAPPKFRHPEQKYIRRKDNKFFELSRLFENTKANEIFNSAASKLTALNYEILGTEQIFQSILESEDVDLVNLLKEAGITKETFSEKLGEFSRKNDEFNHKQIIFTPNAFSAMILALETAKELGSAEVGPEHLILGILKSKSGIAYKVLQSIDSNTTELGEKILQPIFKQMPETLTILRLAKQESRNVGRSVVGSEMILLGILGEGTGIGSQVLSRLGITLKDARIEVEKILGNSSDEEIEDVVYTPRARRLLELAWESAKLQLETKIKSEHILNAITQEQNSLAMQVLENLGCDALEIRQGIELFSKLKP